MALGRHSPVPHTGDPNRVVCGGELILEPLAGKRTLVRCSKCGATMAIEFTVPVEKLGLDVNTAV